MKYMSALACLLVAIDCGERALGSVPQQLFAPSNIWIWWFGAFGWSITALGTIMLLQTRD